MQSPMTVRMHLTKIHNFEPQIVILDLMLPSVSGYDICKKHQQQQYRYTDADSQKMTLLTRLSGLNWERMTISPKPFDIREVIARVKIPVQKI